MSGFESFVSAGLSCVEIPIKAIQFSSTKQKIRFDLLLGLSCCKLIPFNNKGKFIFGNPNFELNEMYET